MKARFARLRIAGFKSFAEPASVEILPGLTGIVGPNGCGKSNVVEALRWVMGESSARSLRGGEMDDLIFAGTAGRPARNVAEVTLTLERLDDVGGELAISRIIERGAGSAYRINGSEARARDVQTLFADLASGARSSAMVSQGRVAAIVNAAPGERRSILEEAAGITGLHARRHEAELKLRAAESNLGRVGDMLRQLEARLGELDAQSAEARRYREIAGGLRDAEAELRALLRARAERALRAAQDTAAAAETKLAEMLPRAHATATAEQQAEAAMPTMREAEAHSRTVLERARIAGETLARDEARRAAETAAALERVERCRGDADAAHARLRDTTAARARIAAQREDTSAHGSDLPDRLRAAEQALVAAATALAQAEAVFAEASATETAARARSEQVIRERDAAQDRLRQLGGLLTQGAADAALAAARTQAEQAGERQMRTAREADAAHLREQEASRIALAAQSAEQEADALALRLAADDADLTRQLTDAQAAHATPEQLQAAQARVDDAVATVAEARQALHGAEQARLEASRGQAGAARRAEDLAHADARAAQAVAAAEAAHASALARDEQLAQEAADAQDRLVPEAALADASSRAARAVTTLAMARDALAQGEAAHGASARQADDAERALGDARAEQARLEAHTEGLSRALTEPAQADSHWPTLAQTMPVPPGLERAFAAVLAETLRAALDEAAPHCWRDLGECDAAPLPEGAACLAGLIEAPAALRRILGASGLIEDIAQGDRLQAMLSPGQCLVTRDGRLWRWDGLRRMEFDAPSAAAASLTQHNRLRELVAQASAAAVHGAKLAERASGQRALHVAAARRVAQARAARDAAERDLAEARTHAAALAAGHAAAQALLKAILPQRDAAARTRQAAGLALDEARANQAALPRLRDAQDRLAAAGARTDSAVVVETAAQATRERTEAALEAARAEQATLRARHAEAESRLEALLPQCQRLRAQHEAAQADAARARIARAALPPPEQTRTALAQAIEAATLARSEAAAQRQALHNAEQQRDQASAAYAEAATLAARLAALQAEAAALPDLEAAGAASLRARQAWTQATERETGCRETRAQLGADAAALEATCANLARAHADWLQSEASARQNHEEALARLTEVLRAYTALAEAPAAEQRAAQDRTLAEAESTHALAQAALERAAQSLNAAQAARRQAELAVADATQADLRARGQLDQAEAMLAQLPEPDGREAPRDLSDAAEASLRRRIARLGRERDEIGPVNLRAEVEREAARAQADEIAREHAELEAAIARLRGSIGHLNREGRERLLAVFASVDAQFQALFARMFNGGRAHLAMVGDEDPLAAGLELYAQPPGKKLAALSLLSGGEQALCALSLIFAVFRCNPAPICVLDEVDAPLDDANVGRFVALLADMVAQTDTRFLVVTHHQLTMAHMDRLYGVTMQERGVSRVLSVDLAAAALVSASAPGSSGRGGPNGRGSRRDSPDAA
ncbi:AAA family ATPase [Lichenicoccus sp.]|uniref:AAA family ATPase n=1 Tax=Lichenicoccus sp. TaxID=2781899 RepID=UPI003D0BA88F